MAFFKREMTLGELHKWFVESYAPNRKTLSSVYEDKGLFNRHLSDWRERRLSSIKPAEVLERHQFIASSSGKYTANRTLALLRCLYNRAQDFQLCDCSNPARGVKKFREQSRRRFLRPEEMGHFLAAVLAYDNSEIRDFILLALLTGQRKTTVLTMRWDDLDLRRAEWNIPCTKNGDPLTVHLCPAALALLERRKLAYSSGWVLPGVGRTGHLAYPRRAFHRIRKAAGISDLRIHDLRRTFGSWQAILGTSTIIVGGSLGHRDPKSTAIYARFHIEPIRNAVNAATDAMMQSLATNQQQLPLF